MKTQSATKIRPAISMGISIGLITAVALATAFGGFASEASAKTNTPTSTFDRIGVKTVDLKIEPIGAKATEDDLLKTQENRMNAINEALNKSLDERAKSQLSYERNKTRTSNRAGRSSQRLETRLDLDSRETRAQRAQLHRDIREETKREQRLNWLNE